MLLMNYLHSVQLVGLTLYSLYPYSSKLDIYSLVAGLDYANFTFMYNAPLKHIEACHGCASFTSFSFAVGDMNWLRMAGALLPCLVAILLVSGALHLFSYSQEYSKYILGVGVQLVFVKVVHVWFSSLLFVGLNYWNQDGLYNYYLLSMHLLSYVVLVPILYMMVSQDNIFR